MSIKYYLSQIEDEIEEAQDIEALKIALYKLMTHVEIHEVSIEELQECVQLITENNMSGAKKYFDKYISLDSEAEAQ